jgi:polyphosphate:AMP phosphotransferase
MLELVDLTKSLPDEAYESVFPDLEIRLGQIQRDARAAGVPVILLFEGWDASGKGTAINRLTQALDPRGFKVHPIREATATEQRYPWLWRFWNATPAAGQWAIFDRSWYGRVLADRISETVGKKDRRQAFEDIQAFERQLSDGGAVIVKFWLHISRAEQKRRFRVLESNKATAWKVGKAERQQHRDHDLWRRAVEDMLERTSEAYAPWTVVEATQGRFTRVKIFETIIQAVQTELDRRSTHSLPVGKPMPVPKRSPTGAHGILDRLDLGLSLEGGDYEKQLDRWQRRLFDLENRLYVARIPAVIVYEGQDAGGKGGNIRRLTRGMDPRGYEVVPVAAPTAEEKSHHYLWRFWKNVPRTGHITIFDRSWYGRVLVERVEGFCTGEEWRRAYREINEFEKQLADSGTVIVKFWLQISRDEQLRRFKDRQETPYKEWKITAEDWRNREKWRQYKVCVEEMLHQTSTSYAPWTILEANCKLYARIKALRTVAGAMEAVLRQRE